MALWLQIVVERHKACESLNMMRDSSYRVTHIMRHHPFVSIHLNFGTNIGYGCNVSFWCKIDPIIHNI